MNGPHLPSRLLAAVIGLAVLAGACSSDEPDATSTSDESPEAAAGDSSSPELASSDACFADPELELVAVDDIDQAALEGSELTLLAYDSFVVSDGIFDAFEAETGMSVTVLTSADTGTMVSEAVLTAGDPVADVMWGIDNTFLCRGLEAGIFVPYESPGLSSVPVELQLDPYHRVTPVDFSDMCVNYWIGAIEGAPPSSLADLALPEYAPHFVTQNPETSAPGMGLLLASIAEFGVDGWEQYWQELADNGVGVTPGWSEAYYGEFIAGGGDRSIVMSYASSPVAELLFADPPVNTPPTASFTDSCFRSVEFAGILRGSENPTAAALLLDFLLSPAFQEDIPLNMFVFPANSDAELPPEFVEWAELSEEPLSLPPEVIEANRDAWTERWTEIVLR